MAGMARFGHQGMITRRNMVKLKGDAVILDFVGPATVMYRSPDQGPAPSMTITCHPLDRQATFIPDL